jgi:hypothetical protein
VSQPIDYNRPIECDVAIVGAELSAMIAGAILAKHGKRVVVVDGPPVASGRGGSVQYRDFWLDNGHRLGFDVTDLEIGWIHGQDACRAADVEMRMNELDTHLRVHLLPEFPAREPAPTVNGDFDTEGFVSLAREGLGVPEALLPDFMKIMARISSADPEEVEAVVEVPLGQWVEDNIEEPAVRTGVLNVAKTIYCQYPERASAGRILGFFSTRHGGKRVLTGFADDDEVGGMGGAAAPFERALRERGGKIVLSHQPVEITFDGDRATGFVALSDNHLALEVRAPTTLITYPIWSALPLLPPERRDPSLVSISERLEDSNTDCVGLVLALKRLPRLRSSGEVETHRGWNRFLIGPEREFRGGYHIPSMSSSAIAPDGKHLLHCLITRWVRREEHVDWVETKATADAARSYLSAYYRDLDECVEWEARSWVQRPAIMGWFWAPVRRHGVAVPGCRNLYLANTTIESDAGPVDISAKAALDATRAILGEG